MKIFMLAGLLLFTGCVNSPPPRRVAPLVWTAPAPPVIAHHLVLYPDGHAQLTP